MTSHALRILMAAAMTSLALAADEPTGTYSALVEVGGEPTQLCLTMSATGYVTGTVRHQRTRHGVRGDMANLTLLAKGQRVPLRLIRPQSGEANGFVTIGGRTAAFAAGRRAPGGIFAARYTVITPALSIKAPPPTEDPGTGEPPPAAAAAAETPAGIRLRPKYLGGHGYGVMTITPQGRFRMTMRLADGQRIAVGENFVAPLSVSFVAAPSVSGSFSGKLRFIEIEDSSDADGVFRWVRDRDDSLPPLLRYAFIAQERLMASRYKPDQIPLKGDTEPRGRMAIKGGILTRNSAEAVYFDDGELDAPEYHFKSRLNQYSGTFASGLILPVYDVPARTGGVVFQKQNRIYGMSETRFGTSGVNIERKVEHEKD